MSISFPIIFLDIDGVVNNDAILFHSHKMFEYNYFDDPMLVDSSMIGEELVELVNRIIRRTGAKVVLSSAWRLKNIAGTPRTLAALRHRGFTGEIIDETPVFKQPQEYSYDLRTVRGAEIHDWLSRHTEVTSWVVLDDNLIDITPQWRFIQTDPMVGISKANINEAVKVLRRSW